MSKKILQYIVILLGILIIFAFIALIYGMYLKISLKSKPINSNLERIYLKLSNEEKIVDIEVIDNNKLLLIIENTDNLKRAIYDIEENMLLEFIEK